MYYIAISTIIWLVYFIYLLKNTDYQILFLQTFKPIKVGDEGEK